MFKILKPSAQDNQKLKFFIVWNYPIDTVRPNFYILLFYVSFVSLQWTIYV